jgi:Protein of unknown function (DUF2726)
VNRRAGPQRFASEPLPQAPWPVVARNLLTEREQSFYQRLLSVYPGHKLFVQVALSQLIDVDRSHPESESIRARYKQLVADFVLCRPDLSVIAIIELDDRSHERADRQRADSRKNKALADAGLRLVRIPAGALPSEERLRTIIDADKAAGIRAVEGPRVQLAAPEAGLQLAEEWEGVGANSLAGPTDSRDAEMKELKWGALKVLLLGVALIGGWFLFTRVLPLALQLAFQPLAAPHAAVKSSTSLPAILTLSRTTNASAASALPADVLAERRRTEVQAAAVLKKQKDLAWMAFYSAPASCEHPADWAAQVECGNRYMRAKREFEKQWVAQHTSGLRTGEGVVLDNAAIGDRHR